MWYKLLFVDRQAKPTSTMSMLDSRLIRGEVSREYNSDTDEESSDFDIVRDSDDDIETDSEEAMPLSFKDARDSLGQLGLY